MLPIFLFCAIIWAKKHHVWPYLLAYLIPFLSWYTVNQGYYWHLIWIVFGNIPLLEFIAGEVQSQTVLAYLKDKENPNTTEEKEMTDNIGFKLVTMVWLPLEILYLNWALWVASNWDLSLSNFVLFAFSCGIATGGLGRFLFLLLFFVLIAILSLESQL